MYTLAPLSEDAILNAFKEVFEGLGHIGNSTFVTDETVKPVQHTPRRVPVALWDDVKEKSLDLEKRGIIKKVTAPTEWISSTVIVAKLGCFVKYDNIDMLFLDISGVFLSCAAK